MRKFTSVIFKDSLCGPTRWSVKENKLRHVFPKGFCDAVDLLCQHPHTDPCVSRTEVKSQHLRDRIEQTQARIDALEEEQGSNLENKSELQRLKQLKNLQADLENKKTELVALQKPENQKNREQARVDKLTIASKEKERDAVEERLNSNKTLEELKEQET